MPLACPIYSLLPAPAPNNHCSLFDAATVTPPPLPLPPPSLSPLIDGSLVSDWIVEPYCSVTLGLIHYCCFFVIAALLIVTCFGLGLTSPAALSSCTKHELPPSASQIARLLAHKHTLTSHCPSALDTSPSWKMAACSYSPGVA